MAALRLELRHLRVLVEIAQAGSIRRAATALRISQPALVGQLRRIEQAVGGEVFTRTHSGVQPTELGRYLIAESGAVIGEFDRLVGDTMARAAEQSRSDTVGVGTMRALDSVTMLTAVSELLPGVDTAIHEPESLRSGLTMLRTGRLDVALMYRFAPGEPVPDTLGQEPVVAVEPAFIGLSAEHPLADLPEVPLEALAGEAWIISGLEDGTGRLAAFHRACAQAGFTPRIRHHAGDCNNAIALLRTTKTVAIMHPMCMVPSDLVIKPLVGSPQRRSIGLYWRPESAVADVIPALLERLVRAYHVDVSLRPHYRTWWEAAVGPLAAVAPPGETAPACATEIVRLGACPHPNP